MDNEQMNHIVAQLTTEADIDAIRDLLRDLDELTAGVHRLAAEALDALKEGKMRQAVQDLERLAVIR